jgi:outer membrane protein OmpA-like peptidoglycan-associated protein/lipopolysaccharide biosynthesis regulator YciM
MGQRSVLLLLLILVIGTLSAQNRKAKRFIDKAEKALDQRDFSKATKLYKKAIEADPAWALPYQKLGVLYFQNRKDSLSIHYLEKGIINTKEYDPRVHHMLGKLYMRNARYRQAHQQWKAFLEKNSTYEHLNEEAYGQMEITTEILEMMKDSVATNLKLLPPAINTSAHEVLPLMPADQRYMIFTRRLRNQEDFFVSYKVEGKWQRARPIESINSPYPEGAATLSADGKTMILTRCESRDSYGNCDLYISFLQNGNWSSPKNLGAAINTPSNEKQAAFSPDGNRLYFSSNRPGGYGGMDIWYIDWLPEGKWSEAKVMDSLINTPHNERAPFIHYDNQTLYFTSDRPEALGRNDLFRTVKKQGQWSEPQKLGWPINTPEDEGTIYVSIDGRTAYMGRRIEQEKSDYDIYSFTLDQTVAATPSTYIHGRVVDAESGQALSALIRVLEKESGNEIAFIKSDSRGRFLLAIPIDKEYQFFANAKGYAYYSRQFNYDDFQNTEEGLSVEIEMKPLDQLPKDTAEPITLENIYFETGSARLKAASKAELEYLFQLLKDNPGLKIEIRGHTDDVGSAQANQNLSMQRAKAVYDYLLNQGIDKGRLRYEGYGESKPIVPNNSPENRQQNRRTEFIIIEP